MDLQELKEKFRHKTKAEIADLDIALQAVPFLVRKIEALEMELSECEKRVAHLSARVAKQRPPFVKGKRDGFEWQVEWDEKKNRLTMRFSGKIDSRVAKFATNSFQPLLAEIEKGADVIIDFQTMSGINNRILFHFRKIFYTLHLMEIDKIIQIPSPQDTSIASALLNITSTPQFRILNAGSVEEAEEILDRAHFLKA